jgi:hypothetical protein
MCRRAARDSFYLCNISEEIMKFINRRRNGSPGGSSDAAAALTRTRPKRMRQGRHDLRSLCIALSQHIWRGTSKKIILLRFTFPAKPIHCTCRVVALSGGGAAGRSDARGAAHSSTISSSGPGAVVLPVFFLSERSGGSRLPQAGIAVRAARYGTVTSTR